MGNNLKDVRKQIGTIKNTQKITRAMKLVSTSKLRKAEGLASRANIYNERLNSVFNDVMSHVLNSGGMDSIQNKLFAEREQVKVVDIIFITSSKGFCGGFNNATIKAVLNLKETLEVEGKVVRLHAIGKKGIEFFKFNHQSLYQSNSTLSSAPDFLEATKFIKSIVEDFIHLRTDKVVLIRNGFKNMISQVLKKDVLLPLGLHAERLEGKEVNNILTMEPDDDDMLLGELANQYINYNLYYALLDSLAAEHAARIQAMDAATNNADDLIKTLSIEYNKMRQASITTELIEINAGIEAMK